MEVTYETTDYKGNPKEESASISDFLYSELLYKEDWNSFSSRVPLEEQPKVVCGMAGRLIEKLIEKNVLNLEDLKYISQCDWGRKADSLKLKEG